MSGARSGRGGCARKRRRAYGVHSGCTRPVFRRVRRARGDGVPRRSTRYVTRRRRGARGVLVGSVRSVYIYSRKARARFVYGSRRGGGARGGVGSRAQPERGRGRGARSSGGGCAGPIRGRGGACDMARSRTRQPVYVRGGGGRGVGCRARPIRGRGRGARMRRALLIRLIVDSRSSNPSDGLRNTTPRANVLFFTRRSGWIFEDSSTPFLFAALASRNNHDEF